MVAVLSDVILGLDSFECRKEEVMPGISYKEKIITRLHGDTQELEAIPKERLDWTGCGAVLDLYDQTSGREREEFIRAMGKIIEEGKEPPFVIAQVLHIAASMGLSQIEPSVKSLQEKEIAAVEVVRSAIDAYNSMREFAFYKPNVTPQR